MKTILKQKPFRELIKHIEKGVGTVDTGTMIAILAVSLDNLTEDVDERTIRTIEIKYNDYFTTKYDFSEQRFIQE